jgi:hypothetical protein
MYLVLGVCGDLRSVLALLVRQALNSLDGPQLERTLTLKDPATHLIRFGTIIDLESYAGYASND